MNPVKPNRQGRDLLHVADAIYLGFHESLEALFGRFSGEELDLIENTAQEFSTTNCGWSEYELVRTQAFRAAIAMRRQTLRRLAEQLKEIESHEEIEA